MNSEQPDYTFWDPLSLDQLLQLLRDLSIPWWIAGGYAIELFVGESFRSHGDIDILVKRQDQLVIQTYLKDWELWRATKPGMKRWEPGEYLEGKYKDIWCRPRAEAPWKLQIMLFDTENDQWIYKRDPNVRGLLEDMYHTSPTGIRYLAPEIQLLYKAKSIREKDEKDFDKTLPLLAESAKSWLLKTLKSQYPQGHEWIEIIVKNFEC